MASFLPLTKWFYFRDRVVFRCECPLAGADLQICGPKGRLVPATGKPSGNELILEKYW
jgi:hypothetical protein